MRIGIDVDDTICDTWNYALPIMCEFYKKDLEIIKNSVTGYYQAGDLTLKDYMAFAKLKHQEYIMQVPLIKNAKEIINKLKEEGNEIIIITARSDKAYTNPCEITSNYLEQHNIKFDKLYSSISDKKEICKNEKIDLFIDDNINNCLSVRELDTKVLLFGENKEYDGIQIKDWEKVYKYLKKLERK